MPAQEATLADIFAIPDARSLQSTGAGETAGRFEELKERIIRETKGIKWPAAMPELAQKVAALFDIALPDIMISAWKKADEIKKTLEESLASPGETTHVTLTEHTISAELYPKIEVTVRGLLVKTLEFVVDLSLTLKGVSLNIRNGRIFEIRTGSCVAEGTAKYKDLVIATKKCEPISLPGTIRIPEPAS